MSSAKRFVELNRPGWNTVIQLPNKRMVTRVRRLGFYSMHTSQRIYP